MKKNLKDFDNLKPGNKPLKKYLLYIDIAGFSSITDELNKEGVEGSEILSQIIKNIFKNAVNIVYKNKGYIATFAGDAFLAIFKSYKNILNSAIEIKKLLDKNKKQSTKFGDFSFYGRIGLSYGNIYKKSINKISYYYGKAIDRAIDLQKVSRKNGITVSKKIFEKSKEIAKYEIENGFYELLKIDKKIFAKNKSNLFINEDIQNEGEFRNIVAFFVKIPIASDFYAIIETAKKRGAFLKDINVYKRKMTLFFVFGAPITNEKSKLHSLDFALELTEKFKKNINIGISYGTIYSGELKTKYLNEYIFLGNTVNLAARLCEINSKKRSEILVTEDFLDTSGYKFKPKGEFSIKGFGKKRKVYSIIEKTKNVDNTVFIGRKSELKKLKDCIDRNEKKIRIVEIIGEAGVGKTILVKKFFDVLNCEKYETVCDSFVKYPFYVVNSLIKIYFKAIPKFNKSVYEKKFNELIEIAKEDKKEKLEEAKDLIANSIGAKIIFNKGISARRRYSIYTKGLTAFFETISLKKVVIIHIDDAQMIDDESLDLFKSIKDKKGNLILLFSSRKEIFESGTKKEKIFVKHFDNETVRNLCKKTIQNDISDALYKFIYEKSKGNPFFIVQILRYLQENGFLKITNSKAELIKPNDFILPDSINEIMVARLDRLSSELKEVIKTASVLGKKFAVNILSAMLQNKPIKSILKRGKKEKIWQSMSELIYIFSHSLIREAAYNMQLKNTLRRLHLLAAETIIKIYQKFPEKHFEEIAFHYKNAEKFKEAGKYLYKAGVYYKKNYHLKKAEKIFDDLIKDKTTDEILKNKAKLELALLMQTKGNFSTAEELFKEVINSQTEIKISGDANNYYGWLYYLKRDYKTAINYYDNALVLYKKIDDKVGLSLVYGHLGVANIFLNKYDIALEYFNKKIELTKQLKRNRGFVEAYLNLSSLFMRKKEYDKAERYLIQTLDYAKKEKNILFESAVYGNLGLLYYYQKKYADALKYYKMDLKLCIKMGDKYKYSLTLGNMALLQHTKKRYNKALETLYKKAETDKKINNLYGLTQAYQRIGTIHYEKKDYKKALKYFKEVEKLSQIKKYRLIGNTYYNTFLVYKKLKKHKNALFYLNRYFSVETKPKNYFPYLEKIELLKKLKMSRKLKSELKNLLKQETDLENYLKSEIMVLDYKQRKDANLIAKIKQLYENEADKFLKELIGKNIKKAERKK